MQNNSAQKHRFQYDCQLVDFLETQFVTFDKKLSHNVYCFFERVRLRTDWLYQTTPFCNYVVIKRVFYFVYEVDIIVNTIIIFQMHIIF